MKRLQIMTKIIDSLPIISILSIAGIAIWVYPELQRLSQGQPIGSGISTVLVGGLVLVLIVGLDGISWASKSLEISRSHDILAILLIVMFVFFGNLLVLYLYPDTPEAIGVLVVTGLGAIVLLKELVSL